MAPLQAFAVPSNAGRSAAACRALADRGLFSALRQSRLLQLRADADGGGSNGSGEGGIAARVAQLRAVALRLLLTVALQLRANRQAVQDVLALVATDAHGCLGPRAHDVLSNAVAAGVRAQHALALLAHS